MGPPQKPATRTSPLKGPRRLGAALRLLAGPPQKPAARTSPLKGPRRLGAALRLLAVRSTALLLGTWAGTAGAWEFHGAVSVAPEWLSDDAASPYFVGPPTVVLPHRASRQDFELRAQEGGFNAQGIMRQRVAEGSRPEYHGIANQFYYDGQLSPSLGWTAGKKVLTWGVGFAFKPLDVVQREDRRAVDAPPLVGQPLAVVERFTATDALTLAWVRPGQGRGDSDADDPALALHGYRLAGADDYHAVTRLSRRRGFEAGVGTTHVIGDEWSIYAAALYSQRYRLRLNRLLDNGGLLAGADPTAEASRHDSLKAVAGGQWTGESGWTMLVEAWYDGDAYRRADWQRLDTLTARQRAAAAFAPGTAIDGNIAWSSQAYLTTNLLRENLLARLSYDDRDGFKPYAELLLTPSDRGLVMTVGASLEGNRQRLSVALRQLGGAADSAYGQAPIRRLLWAEWRLAMF
jgi:hypothetical protein